MALLAVSKVQPAEAIRAAFAAGQRAFGESYVQEALAKHGRAGRPALEWHFIGRIQGNKTRPIADHFAWVHGLCDLHHARRLDRPAPGPPAAPAGLYPGQHERRGEQGGAGPDGRWRGCSRPARAPERIRIRGLMTLPAAAGDEAEQRRPCAPCASCATGWPAPRPLDCPVHGHVRRPGGRPSPRGRPWCGSGRRSSARAPYNPRPYRRPSLRTRAPGA